MGYPIRPARRADLPACADLRTDSIAGYRARLGLEYRRPDRAALIRALGHLLDTDPPAFLVATRGATGNGQAIVGMVSAMRREAVWYLNALYVDEAAQRQGLGRQLLQRVLPEPGPDQPQILAACTDSLQPISNAVYARLGIVPAEPVFRIAGRLSGRPDGRRPALRTTPLPEVRAAAWNGMAAVLGEVDRSVLGFDRRLDHDYFRAESRAAWLVEEPDGSPIGYGYARSDGSIGPVAVLHSAAMPAVLGAIAAALDVPAVQFWLGGSATQAFAWAMQAGLRLEGYPALACWTSRFIDFGRYVPWDLMLP